MTESPAQKRVISSSSTNNNSSSKKQCMETSIDTSETHEDLSILEEPIVPTEHESQTASLQTEIEILKAKLQGKDRENQTLKDSLTKCQTQLSASNRKRKELLTSMADELHRQYSAKHIQKVTTLKQTITNRYNDRISELESRNDSLNREITLLHQDIDSLSSQVTTLTDQISQERTEKEELVLAYDQYLQLESNNNRS